MSEEKYKSRKLSTFDYYETIQIEYICCKLRAKIYTRPKDKEYWNRVAEGKKQTIESISERNQLPSIFTDSDCEAALQRRVFRDNTYPIFVYRDETHRLSQEYYDLLYYYTEGTHVRYDIGLGVQVGTISQYKPFDKSITVTSAEGEKISIQVDNVVRIL